MATPKEEAPERLPGVLSWKGDGNSQAKLLLFYLGLFWELNRARMPSAPGNLEMKMANNATPSPPGSSKMALLHMQCRESVLLLLFFLTLTAGE